MKDVFKNARFRQAPGKDGVVPTPVSKTIPSTSSGSTTTKKTGTTSAATTPATTPAATPAAKTTGYTGYNYGGYSGGYSSGGGEAQEAADPAALAAAAAENITNQMNDVAKKNYKRSMKTISNLYDTTSGMYDQNLQSNNRQLAEQAEYSRQLANADAEQAMREAYVNQMLSRRDMSQWLASQGLTGGASETTRASLENAYQNARAQVDASRNKNVSDINMNYNTNIAEAIRQYNQQLAELAAQKAQMQMQAENRYAGNQMSALQLALQTALRYIK